MIFVKTPLFEFGKKISAYIQQQKSGLIDHYAKFQIFKLNFSVSD